MLFLEADYKPNSSLSTSKLGKNHSEIATKIKKAKESNSLHLPNLNLDFVFPEVFGLTNLVRLDLSYNNLVRLDASIGQLVDLRQLWLNDNPLRELPVELSSCVKIRELDLKNTFIITLPRELADLQHLVDLKLESCQLKTKLDETYKEGMASMH